MFSDFLFLPFSSCHKDHYENIYVVIAGEKHFTLLPPTDAPFMYERMYPQAHFKQEPSGKWKVRNERQGLCLCAGF